MAAAQALDFREFTPGKGVRAAHEVVRRHVEHLARTGRSTPTTTPWRPWSPRARSSRPSRPRSGRWARLGSPHTAGGPGAGRRSPQERGRRARACASLEKRSYPRTKSGGSIVSIIVSDGGADWRRRKGAGRNECPIPRAPRRSQRRRAVWLVAALFVLAALAPAGRVRQQQQQQSNRVSSTSASRRRAAWTPADLASVSTDSSLKAMLPSSIVTPTTCAWRATSRTRHGSTT